MEKQLFEIGIQGVGEGEIEGQEGAEIKEIKTGPVTVEDVRAVVDDPFATNANRVREILGRGSNATIQKHLQQLREELQREREVRTGDAPEAPDIVIQSLWLSAWHAAVAQVRTRMEQIVEERDSYRASAEANAADAEALALAVDEVRTLAEQQAQERAEAEQQAADAAVQALAEVNANADARIAKISEQLDQVRVDVDSKDREISGLKQEAETSALKWEIERQTLRGLNSELQEKLQALVLERDKIFERVERIQVDADSRVSKIEAAAKAEIAKTHEEARSAIAEIEARTNDEIASLRTEKEAAEKEAGQIKAKKK